LWLDVFQNPGYERYDNEDPDYEFSAWVVFRNLIHFSQMSREDDFYQWNTLDTDANDILYTDGNPEVFPIEDIDTTNIFAVYGDWDRIAREDDIDFLKDNLATAEWYEIDGGHATTLQAQDMSWFADEVLPFIEENLPEEPVIPV